MRLKCIAYIYKILKEKLKKYKRRCFSLAFSCTNNKININTRCLKNKFYKQIMFQKRKREQEIGRRSLDGYSIVWMGDTSLPFCVRSEPSDIRSVCYTQEFPSGSGPLKVCMTAWFPDYLFLVLWGISFLSQAWPQRWNACAQGVWDCSHVCPLCTLMVSSEFSLLHLVLLFLGYYSPGAALTLLPEHHICLLLFVFSSTPLRPHLPKLLECAGQPSLSPHLIHAISYFVIEGDLLFSLLPVRMCVSCRVSSWDALLHCGFSLHPLNVKVGSESPYTPFTDVFILSNVLQARGYDFFFFQLFTSRVYGDYLQIDISHQDAPPLTPKSVITSFTGHPSFHILGSLEAGREV